MKISVITPIKNEHPWLGYSIMAILPYIHEVVYAVATSDDGTNELLDHIKAKYAGDKLKLIRDSSISDFNPMDMKAYNRSFNACIERATGDACWFLHPDMLVINPEKIADVKEGPLAWWTNITSFAGDFSTKITKGRVDKWKNIQAKKFGLHYFGGYGSVNEDFYHSDITGNAYKHYGSEFSKYPYSVMDSGIKVNHYCELKGYKRRLEKMKLSIKTQSPNLTDARIEELAVQHPRVTLEEGPTLFGKFEFTKTEDAVPAIITKYKAEFEAFKREGELVHG